VIKVVIPLKPFESWAITEELIKTWCRKTFGQNRQRGPQTWRGTFTSSTIYRDNGIINNYYIVFYFATEEHANWFRLRWT